MGLMDKVKAQAQNVAAEAKKATAQAQGKVGQMQLRKKADEAAKQLGYLVHKERTGGAAGGSDADRLVAEITDLERQMAEEEGAAGSASPEPPAAPASSDATPGDFKL
jgi:membrane protein involved in colicin uptake